DFAASRAGHTLGALPAVFARRLWLLADHLPSALLALPLVFGFAAAGALLFPLLFAAALLLVGLLFHATEKFYLLEAAPVLALLVGAGLDRMTAAIRAVGSRPARAALVALCGAAAVYVAVVIALDLRAQPARAADRAQLYQDVEEA